MGDKSPSAGASGTSGRSKQPTPSTGSSAQLSQEELNSRAYDQVASQETGIALLNEVYGQQTSLTATQAEALAAYKSNDFVYMNALLRRPEEWGTMLKNQPEKKAEIEAAVNALTTAPPVALGKDLMLYRGMYVDEAPGAETDFLRTLIFGGIKKGTLIGSQFTDKGFGSTSLNNGVGEYNIQMRIRAPKETKVFIPEPNGQYKTEQEVLLRNNTTYTIRNYQKQGDKIILDVDLE